MKYYPVEGKGNKVRAKLTGEFRPPRKGEYYLSGAIPTAYVAPNDLTVSFHIAKLVKTELIEREVQS